MPFNVTVRDKVPGAVKLPDASAYYPQAAIIGGWAAANDYYEPNKETLAKLIKGWAEANDYIVAKSNEAMESLQKAIGIGGSLSAPPLPHHRTYGSVYGGSRG